MPNINTMKSSKFLKKEDVGIGKLFTIRACTQENVAMEGAAPEMKWCLHFMEEEKPMVLNSTNMQIAAAACGSQETDDWNGRKIVAFEDPNISFGGKLVGGIRLRAPRGAAANTAPVSRPAAAAPAPAQPAQTTLQPLPAGATSGGPEGLDKDLPF